MSRTEVCTRLALRATTTTAMRNRRAPETTSVTLFFFVEGTEREKGIETSKIIMRESGVSLTPSNRAVV
jgi:hypothetical protein